MNFICPHFSCILFCLQLVCWMLKHKLLKAVAVLQLIERVLVLRVLFPPISPKNLSFIDNILFDLISSTFFDREPHSPKNMLICLFFATCFCSSFFFFHVKEKRENIKIVKETIELEVCGHEFFSLLYCTP